MTLAVLDGLAIAALFLLALAMAESSSPVTRKRAMSHKQYLDTLQRPSSTTIRHISAVQQHNEERIDAKYHSSEEHQAATKIQKAYRGYRDRRQLDGMVLDPSARWTEALREVRYRSATASGRRMSSNTERPASPAEKAREKWRRVGQIAEHAAGEDCSVRGSSEAASVVPGAHPASDPMFLDLRYFLEMVDSKHRYGTNLQVYHEEWQRAATKQNFFEWLDHGEGRHMSLIGCSREKLDKERIRYLSREERKDYEVQVDDAGRLRWQKDGELITTSSEQYKDSVHGIVPKDSSEPAASPIDSSSEELSSDETDPVEASLAHQQVTADKLPRKHLFRVSPATILNHLLRASIRPGTWIYVADTCGRLYVGIKSSGAFQHASFLAGARISSAGAIGIENGRLTYLSPLSGHYRPTTKSFKAFIETLKQQGVDLSHLRVSKAYDILLGMEYYGKTKKGAGKLVPHHDAAGRRRSKGAAGLGADHTPSAELVQQHWDEAHPPRGFAKLMGDLHIRRRHDD